MVEATGPDVGKIAARAMRKPQSLSLDEIQALAASALTQRPNRKKPMMVRHIIEIDGRPWELTLKPLELP